MLLEEMIAGCGSLPAVIMQPHQNHEVLMPGRAHTVGRITASRLFLTARPCDATTPTANHQTPADRRTTQQHCDMAHC